MDAVPAGVLGAVEGCVRARDQTIDGCNRLVRNRGTDTDRGTDRVRVDGRTGRLEARAHAFGDLGCALKATRHDRDEFFAAEASDDVVSARARPHHPAEQAQDLVARSMAKAIIDRLEVIEIE